MKRPYSEGDWFGVPLGDGTHAAGIVVRGTRRVLEGYFFGARPGRNPALADVIALRASDAIWSGRFSDRALVQCRWPMLGSQPRFVKSEWPVARAGDIAEPHLVEEMLASLQRGTNHRRPQAAFYDVRSPIAPPAAAGWGDGRVQWRARLVPSDLERVEAHVRARAGGVRVRLYGEAAAQAGELAAWPNLTSLGLHPGRLPASLPPFPYVRELELEAPPERLGAVLGAFPEVRVLRVRGRGGRLDARDLRAAAQLEALDLHRVAVANAPALHGLRLRVLDVRDARLDDIDASLELPLDALRLRRIAGLRSIAALRGAPRLRVLALDQLLGLDDVGVLATLPRLESLELTGMWQLSLDDVALLAGIPGLRRLRLDIGGRRKNVELYRRLSLAEPAPFDAAVELASARDLEPAGRGPSVGA